MLLIPNATNNGTKSRLLLPAHSGNQQSCLQDISVMLPAPVKLDAILCDQHALVINGRAVSYSIRRAVASLSPPGGQDNNISPKFLHFPVLSLIFPQIFFIFSLILVLRAGPGKVLATPLSIPLTEFSCK